MAVHICVFLAYREGVYVPSSELAESVRTNPVVIRRLVHDLIQHGIVESASGPQGGFRLSRAPENVTLGQLYEATRENELFKRPAPNPDCVVSSNLDILLHDAFGEAEECLARQLDKSSIADLYRHLRDILGPEKAAIAIQKGK